MQTPPANAPSPARIAERHLAARGRWLAGAMGVVAFAGALGATAVLAELVNVLPAHPAGRVTMVLAAVAVAVGGSALGGALLHAARTGRRPTGWRRWLEAAAMAFGGGPDE